MAFQIHALPSEKFAPLFALTDEALNKINARREVVQSKPGTPCRISLEDAEVGETVILLHYEHQPANSPFKASHAIFVRANVRQAKLAANTVPEVLKSRLISLRIFDQNDMMIDADVADGLNLSDALNKAFEEPSALYIHLHYAKPGCFAAMATRS